MSDQTIASVFQQDHHQLDRLLEQYRQLKHVDFHTAKESFKQFLTGLQRHIVWEEDLLFPLWEEASGMTGGGPTHVMRLEHRQIKELLHAIHEKIRAHDVDTDQEERQLIEVLTSHNMKEERILYPAIDQRVGPAERARLFQDMRDVPEARYAKCCDEE